MITIEIGTEEYQLPQAHEFTINDMARFKAAADKYKSEGVKYWALVFDIPMRAMRKLSNAQFNWFTSVIRNEWESFEEKGKEEALKAERTITIDGETYDIPQNLGELEIGRIVDCDLFADANEGDVWAYLPFMLAIMCDRKGWDYEEAIKADERNSTTIVKDSFGKANALQALSTHFFFLLIGQGYKVSISDKFLALVMRGDGSEQAEIS